MASQLVVVSKVKQVVTSNKKFKKMRISKDALDKLSDEVEEVVLRAAEKAAEAGLNTIKSRHVGAALERDPLETQEAPEGEEGGEG